MRVFYTHEQIAEHATSRPAGYVERLMKAAVNSTVEGVTFEVESPAWKELEAEFAGADHARGLGDTIAKVTALLRLDQLVQATARILGLKSCGCERRRKWLNRMMPFDMRRDKFGSQR
jgi:hypothetical protein